MNKLNVFRHFSNAYEQIGSLAIKDDGLSFQYSIAYLDGKHPSPISLSLPLQGSPFSKEECEPFFAGLMQEGEMKRLFARAIHASSDEIFPFLERFNNESIGGLLLSANEDLNNKPANYKPIEKDGLLNLSSKPEDVAFELGMQSRLSLSGAQTKVGLYHAGNSWNEGWFIPEGLAPSSHILKVASPNFEGETVNEALCLETAKKCGFSTANWHLIQIENREPLLAIERFDRSVTEASQTIDGLVAPQRRHQEDFAQASYIKPSFKYEPTDGHYAARAAEVITDSSSNVFADRLTFYKTLLFNYLIGNCDNHLKNHSMLWDIDWSERFFSPLYDIVCTTYYPSIYLEMGISLCKSRRIDEVTAEDIKTSASSIGIPERLARDTYRNLHESFLPTLENAETAVLDLGYPQAKLVTDHIRKEFELKVKPF